MNTRVKKNLTVGLLVLGMMSGLWACVDLDVPPKGNVDDAILGSTEGAKTYLSLIYEQLPVWQFTQGTLAYDAAQAYSGESIDFRSFGLQVGGGTFTGRLSEWITAAWDYGAIRNVNYFLEIFPSYASSFPAQEASQYLAEAYFARAFRYFEMAKRFGGVPIVDKTTYYPDQSAEELKVPRNKEADVYDFILNDLDEAARHFTDDFKEKGRSNKWSALALKSRVALWAASIATFGPAGYPAGHLYKDGLTGVPTERAKEFYEIAYNAAKEVVNSGRYELYKAKWKAGDAAAAEENYVQLFLDQTDGNKEMMFGVYYLDKNNRTMIEANWRPEQVGRSYGNKPCPPVDMIERFEYADGTPVRFDEATIGSDAAPVFYNTTGEMFQNMEPRLRASIVVPDHFWNGPNPEEQGNIEIRYGIVPSGGNLSGLLTAPTVTPKYPDDPDDPNAITIRGKSGVGTGDLGSTCTGFYLRKFLNPSTPVGLTMSWDIGGTSPWPEIRYAEVLLNIAEAAVELKELGDASKMTEAATIINDLRERGGSFNRNFTAATLTRADVRSERRRELYVENKTYWDLSRWRVLHEEINNTQYRLLHPILFWDTQKYYMQVVPAGDNFRKTFNPQYYYQSIPGTNTNEKLELNPGY
ncbi:MAG: RagB/SusD family nutrient uptake outer membrane protein [Bacteroidales bacterium]|jgi:hypothetical protein|nr:RagB/SusD family nutrient uptake outer membrane protein [Bacteroidales bacterium]